MAWALALKRVATLKEKVKWLGGHIRQCFKGWLGEFREPITEAEFISALDEFCLIKKSRPQRQISPAPPVVPAYLDFLNRELGDHLIEVKQRKNAEGIHIRPLISPAFKVARILSNHTGNAVSPEDLPTWSTKKPLISAVGR